MSRRTSGRSTPCAASYPRPLGAVNRAGGSCRSNFLLHTSLPIGGGLGGPLRASPKGPMAPAKPALELGFADRLLVPDQITSSDSVLGRDQFSSTCRMAW